MRINRIALAFAGVIAVSAITACGNDGLSPFAAGAVALNTARPVPTPSPTPTRTSNPTPTPTATPIPTPTPGSLAASSASISIGNANPSTASVTINESNYSGALTETNTCAGVATVTQSSATGPSSVLSITQIAAGSCFVKISDNHGGSVTVTVTSTTSSIIIDSHGRPQ